MSTVDPRTAYRLVSPAGSPIVGTSERMYGTALIGRVEVSDDGSWDFEHEGWTEVDWNSMETVNAGTDRRYEGAHGDCRLTGPHSHPDAAYDEFIAADGSFVLRRDVRLEYWSEAQQRWLPPVLERGES